MEKYKENLVLRWENVEGDIDYTITSNVVSKKHLPGIALTPKEATPPSILRFTKPTRFINSQNKEIVALAEEITQNTPTVFESVFKLAEWVRENIGSNDAAARGAASQYLRLFALTAIACLWVDIVGSIREKKGPFYATKRKTALFYLRQVLPETESLHRVIIGGAKSLADYSVDDFSH